MTTGDGDDAGHGRLHEPEQARGQGGRQARGYLGVWLRALRDADGQAERLKATTCQTCSRRCWRESPTGRCCLAELSPVLGTVLRRCLHKDRKQRIRDIGDVSLALTGAFDTTAETAQAFEDRRSLWRRAIPSLPRSCLVDFWLPSLHGAVRPRTSRELSVASTITSRRISRSEAAAEWSSRSPRMVAISSTTRSEDCICGRWMRSRRGSFPALKRDRDTKILQAVTGPFFAPGGEAIGYFEDGQLKRIESAAVRHS